MYVRSFNDRCSFSVKTLALTYVLCTDTLITHTHTNTHTHTHAHRKLALVCTLATPWNFAIGQAQATSIVGTLPLYIPVIWLLPVQT